MTTRIRTAQKLAPCECGCGEMMQAIDAGGRPHRFKRGHHRKGHAAWNSGKTYTINREVYANKASWHNAAIKTLGNKCMKCGWDKAGCDVHHRIPKSKGGLFTLENAIVLCPNCHRETHALM